MGIHLESQGEEEHNHWRQPGAAQPDGTGMKLGTDQEGHDQPGDSSPQGWRQEASSQTASRQIVR